MGNKTVTRGSLAIALALSSIIGGGSNAIAKVPALSGMPDASISTVQVMPQFNGGMSARAGYLPMAAPLAINPSTCNDNPGNWCDSTVIPGTSIANAAGDVSDWESLVYYLGWLGSEDDYATYAAADQLQRVIGPFGTPPAGFTGFEPYTWNGGPGFQYYPAAPGMTPQNPLSGWSRDNMIPGDQFLYVASYDVLAYGDNFVMVAIPSSGVGGNGLPTPISLLLNPTAQANGLTLEYFVFVESESGSGVYTPIDQTGSDNQFAIPYFAGENSNAIKIPVPGVPIAPISEAGGSVWVGLLYTLAATDTVQMDNIFSFSADDPRAAQIYPGMGFECESPISPCDPLNDLGVAPDPWADYTSNSAWDTSVYYTDPGNSFAGDLVMTALDEVSRTYNITNNRTTAGSANVYLVLDPDWADPADSQSACQDVGGTWTSANNCKFPLNKSMCGMYGFTWTGTECDNNYNDIFEINITLTQNGTTTQLYPTLPKTSDSFSAFIAANGGNTTGLLNTTPIALAANGGTASLDVTLSVNDTYYAAFDSVTLSKSLQRAFAFQIDVSGSLTPLTLTCNSNYATAIGSTQTNTGDPLTATVLQPNTSYYSNDVTLPAPCAVATNAQTPLGYIFESWNTEPDGSGQDISVVFNASATNPPDNDLTYYAIWAEYPFTLTCNPNPPISGTGLSTTYQKYEITDLMPNCGTDPVVKGYTFNGWLSSSGTNFNTDFPADSAAATKSLTYTGSWTPTNYTLTCDINLPAGVTSSLTTTETPYTVQQTMPNCGDPSLPGYTFGGWFDSANVNFTSTFPNATTMAPAESLTYTARWIPNSYTLTCDLNYGTVGYTPTATDPTVPNQTFLQGNPMPPCPTLTGDSGTPTVPPGYQFGGWFDTRDANGNPMPTGTTTPNQNQTYYAKWIRDTDYTIVCNPNYFAGAKGIPATPITNVVVYEPEVSWVGFDESDTEHPQVHCPVDIPAPTGYGLAGWTTVPTDPVDTVTQSALAFDRYGYGMPDATEIPYPNVIDPSFNTAIQAYAVWRPVVTYYANGGYYDATAIAVFDSEQANALPEYYKQQDNGDQCSASASNPSVPCTQFAYPYVPLNWDQVTAAIPVWYDENNNPYEFGGWSFLELSTAEISAFGPPLSAAYANTQEFFNTVTLPVGQQAIPLNAYAQWNNLKVDVGDHPVVDQVAQTVTWTVTAKNVGTFEEPQLDVFLIIDAANPDSWISTLNAAVTALDDTLELFDDGTGTGNTRLYQNSADITCAADLAKLPAGAKPTCTPPATSNVGPNENQIVWQMAALAPGASETLEVVLPLSSYLPVGSGAVGMGVTAIVEAPKDLFVEPPACAGIADTPGLNRYDCVASHAPGPVYNQLNATLAEDNDQWDYTPWQDNPSNLKVAITPLPYTSTGGGRANWEITVLNDGNLPTNAVTVGIIMDSTGKVQPIATSLPSGTSLTVASPDTDPSHNPGETQLLNWYVGALQPGQSLTMTLANPLVNLTNDGDTCLTAYVYSPANPFPIGTNPLDAPYYRTPDIPPNGTHAVNNGTVGTEVAAAKSDTDHWDYNGYRPDNATKLQIGVSPDKLINDGKDVTWTVTVQNNGTKSADPVKVTVIADALNKTSWHNRVVPPTGTSVGNFQTGQAYEHQTFVWTIGHMEPGASATLTVTIPVSDLTWDGDICLTAYVYSPKNPYKGNAYDLKANQWNYGVVANDTDQWDYDGYRPVKKAALEFPQTPASPLAVVPVRYVTNTGTHLGLLFAAIAVAAAGAEITLIRRHRRARLG